MYPSLQKFYELVDGVELMNLDEINLISERINEKNANMARDYDTPVNKWELTLPSQEKRLKNRNKRKSKK